MYSYLCQLEEVRRWYRSEKTSSPKILESQERLAFHEWGHVTTAVVYISLSSVHTHTHVFIWKKINGAYEWDGGNLPSSFSPGWLRSCRAGATDIRAEQSAGCGRRRVWPSPITVAGCHRRKVGRRPAGRTRWRRKTKHQLDGRRISLPVYNVVFVDGSIEAQKRISQSAWRNLARNRRNRRRTWRTTTGQIKYESSLSNRFDILFPARCSSKTWSVKLVSLCLPCDGAPRTQSSHATNQKRGALLRDCKQLSKHLSA